MAPMKLSVLTAYDFNTAKALEEAGIDVILVGDSLAMVALGHPDTTKVTRDEMLTFTRAVKRGAPKTSIIADIPFETISKSVEEIIEDSKMFIEAGAEFVKIEGAEKKELEVFKKLKELGIKTVGHIGFTPQTFEKFTNGRLVKDEEKLFKEAKLLEAAGVSLLILEMVQESIAKKLTESISVPTIGIGAGKDCAGQVLVTDDLLGRYSVFLPSFVKRYSEQYEDMLRSFKDYISEVRESKFPV